MCCKVDHNILVTAIGNPNVDITIKLKDSSLFQKYDLPYNATRASSLEFLRAIEQEFKEHAVEEIMSPGGCAQNTLRVFQWLMNSKFDSAIVGSVGRDEYGSFLEEELKNCGVVTNYTKVEEKTSFVYILTHKDYQTAVYGVDIGAARQYSRTHLLTDTKALLSIQRSKIVHLEGFFTMHNADVGLEALKICSKRSIITSFNICGEYVPQKSADAVIPFVENCDIVIGTRGEFLACCRVMNIPTSDFEASLMAVHKIMLSKNIARSYELKIMEKHKKILLVTDGSAPIHCVTDYDGLIKFDVPIIEQTLIKDTTGAGDSFSAGFFYGLLHELPIELCLETGCKVALEIIQEHGCVIPNKSSSSVIPTLS